MKPRNQSNADDRAVSPVIGVILMVAITVILAAVIGTFVLGLGDQLGDTAPQASFSVDETTATEVTIVKTGGETLDTNDLTLSVNGNRIADSTASFSGNDWESGGSETLTHDQSEGEYTLRLIHDPSGNAVYETTIEVPAP
ncbi:type IV pilin N-terminal domain-containing protein [Halorubrum distributum]|uniref:type IV pilin N-terminal domain-containing protein n=1 Tax=Halorubrum distributum TaxID=29283 RepID=UPI002954E625|nr:type IV pilin N-terminal domain-containing protein [Halorubrum distributum]MDV7351296.1 type IV pilin N-terminal domain-containing protein [Halorubrum distributum]